MGIASHRAGRSSERWTDVRDVSNACLEWPGRFWDEWTMGADHRKRAIRCDAGELVRGESVADGNDLPEYREFSDDESGICVVVIGKKCREGNTEKSRLARAALFYLPR